MNDGWVKLWRKSKDSEIFLQDPTAWRVFEYLLMSVDYSTGKYTSGRNRDAMYLRIKPTTFYQALKRLEKKWLSIDIKSNNKYSTISIVNWHKYQRPDDTSNDNKMTTNRQQNDTNQEIKKTRNKENIQKKEEYNSKTLLICKDLGIKPTVKLEEYIIKYGDKELKPVVDNLIQWCSENNKKITGLRFMNWLRREFK